MKNKPVKISNTKNTNPNIPRDFTSKGSETPALLRPSSVKTSLASWNFDLPKFNTMSDTGFRVIASSS